MCAGCSAGDSVGPVLGAIVFDRAGGLQATYILQTAINVLALAVALAVLLVWLWAGSRRRGGEAASASLSLRTSSMVWRSSSSDSSITNTPTATIFFREGSAAASEEAVKHLRMTRADRGALNLDLNFSVQMEPGTRKPCECLQDNIYTQSRDIHQHGGGSMSLCIANPSCACHQKVVRLVRLRSLQHSDSAQDIEMCCHSAGSKVLAKELQAGILSGVSAPDDMPGERSRLDIAAVVDTVRDHVVFSQCMLVFLEQTVTSTVLVVIPVVMSVPTWVVGTVYIALVSLFETGGTAMLTHAAKDPLANHTAHVRKPLALLLGQMVAWQVQLLSPHQLALMLS